MIYIIRNNYGILGVYSSEDLAIKAMSTEHPDYIFVNNGRYRNKNASPNDNNEFILLEKHEVK